LTPEEFHGEASPHESTGKRRTRNIGSSAVKEVGREEVGIPKDPETL